MKLKDVEQYLYDMDVERNEVLLEETKEYRAIVSELTITIPKLNLNIQSATYLSFDEAEQDYLADHDFYYFTDTKTNEFVYSEYGSSLEVCLNNYLHGVNQQMSMNDISELGCNGFVKVF